MRFSRILFAGALLLALAYFATTAVAQADSPRSCPSEWPNVQAADGATFASVSACARYTAKGGVLWRPSLSVSPTAVVANEVANMTGAGFHPNASLVFSVAVAGDPPYFTGPAIYPTDASGNVVIGVHFASCGAAAPYRLILTLTDSFGVHASAELTLC